MDKEAQGKCKQSSAAPAIRQAWVEKKSVGHYHYHLPEMTNREAQSVESAAFIANISPFMTNKNMGDTYAKLDFDKVLTLGHTISQKACYRGAYTPHLCSSLYPTQ